MRPPAYAPHADFADIIQQALRDGRSVTLEPGERSGFHVAIDGVVLADDTRHGFPWESFCYPVDRITLSDDAEALARDLLREKHRRGYRARERRLATETHCAAHGEELPAGAGADGGTA